jgi:diguanylate cyclase (GGDEF)-like protein
MAARFSGQRFLLLLPDVSPRDAATLVEKLRQTIEKSRFRHRGQEIRVTVSCAVTEASSADSPEALFARTEATLYEAKRYGRNRTFLHEGKYPTPVIPPSFVGGEKEIEL